MEKELTKSIRKKSSRGEVVGKTPSSNAWPSLGKSEKRSGQHTREKGKKCYMWKKTRVLHTAVSKEMG